MKRSIITLATLLALSSVGTNFASAQFGTLGQPPARPRPTVSPYVNLGVGGGMSAFNYYGIIRPQLDTARSINQLQTGVQLLNADGSLKGALSQNQPNALGGLQTGHPGTFFNYSHYFPMSAGSTGTGSAAGIGGANPGNRTFFGSTLNNVVR